MAEPYQIQYLLAKDHYFPEAPQAQHRGVLFRIAHEIWAAGSTYAVAQQEGVTWLQIRDGAGEWQIGDKRGLIQKGRLICYGMQNPCIISVRRAMELRLIYTYSSGGEVAKEYGLSPGTVRDLAVAAKPCWELLRQMLDCALSELGEKQQIVHSLLQGWLAWTSGVRNSTATENSIAEQARNWMEARLEQIRSLSQIAEHCGCSVEHLGRLFQARYGESPWRYLRRRQMQLAADILRHGGMKIEAVADRFGFSDRYSFTKTFKKYYGTTPGKRCKFFGPH